MSVPRSLKLLLNVWFIPLIITLSILLALCLYLMGTPKLTSSLVGFLFGAAALVSTPFLLERSIRSISAPQAPKPSTEPLTHASQTIDLLYGVTNKAYSHASKVLDSQSEAEQIATSVRQSFSEIVSTQTVDDVDRLVALLTALRLDQINDRTKTDLTLQAEAVVLVYIHDLDYAQAAAALGISESVVKKRAIEGQRALASNTKLLLEVANLSSASNHLPKTA